ncbi:MAG TPA: HK97 gp10 family phage protein [Candidatus Avoscillospira avistercoris]|uniref:HK97 gp10 family phage protein n=1 Tax=Candidatus Avoscillospira avistercoris TaxID=2840707 RepID=A0A9D1F9J1_9FIRM|nr:HK97 gp10 family phage protein [Candidatus Avoscillospira avistercoris]
MATIRFSGIDAYMERLQRLEQDSEEILKRAVYDGAAIVADEVRQRLHAVLSPDATGQLESSLGISKIQNDQGYVNARIGFDGYDSKGVPNQLKANVLESGSTRQPKRPFMRPAVNAARRPAEAKMEQVVEQEIETLMR